jgi:hypothetical protein
VTIRLIKSSNFDNLAHFVYPQKKELMHQVKESFELSVSFAEEVTSLQQQVASLQQQLAKV